jgi:uncharacterized damage-inducible protein DinB
MKGKILQKQGLYNKMVGDLIQKLSTHSFEQLNRKPADGGWSAIQTMHHLILSEEKSIQYVEKKVQYGADAPQVGLKSWARMAALKLFLWAPFKIKAPGNVSPENLPEGVSLEDTQKRWMAVRTKWDVFFEKMPDEYAQKELFKHQVAGRMGFEHMIDFYVSHFNRHYAQIMRALR